MKYLLLLSAFLATSAMARDVFVQPHVNRDGTYVQGHMRTAPDSNVHNNYSTQGNVNPYTGNAGTVNPYAQPAPAPAYQPYQPYQPYQQRR